MSNVGMLLGRPASVLQHLPSKELVSDSMVGVEVELEEMGRASYGTTYWDVVHEGSMRREGREFVFKQPLFGQDVVHALEELEATVSEYAALYPIDNIVDDNTSVHIHVDCRDLDIKQLHNFILLAILFEQVLFTYAAPDRENNIFCLPLVRAEQEISAASRLLRNGETMLKECSEEASKYSSINLAALAVFGSIEFRAHAGEWRKEPLLRWINILLSLKEAAKKDIITMDNYCQVLEEVPSSVLLHTIFGEALSSIVSNPNIDRQLITGAKVVNEVLEMATQEYTRFSSIEEGSLLTKYVARNKPATGTDEEAEEALMAFLRNYTPIA